jgi:hypothetical protein
MNIRYFEESGDHVTVPDMREPFRVGFERSACRRNREFVDTVTRDARVVEPPTFEIVTMDREELERLPKFHYYG